MSLTSSQRLRVNSISSLNTVNDKKTIDFESFMQEQKNTNDILFSLTQKLQTEITDNISVLQTNIKSYVQNCIERCLQDSTEKYADLTVRQNDSVSEIKQLALELKNLNSQLSDFTLKINELTNNVNNIDLRLKNNENEVLSLKEHQESTVKDVHTSSSTEEDNSV